MKENSVTEAMLKEVFQKKLKYLAVMRNLGIIASEHDDPVIMTIGTMTKAIYEEFMWMWGALEMISRSISDYEPILIELKKYMEKSAEFTKKSEGEAKRIYS